MAVVARSLQPRLESSLHSRRSLPLQGANTLVIMAVLVALMALATLAQTGRVSTRGYQLAMLDQQQSQLIRERDQLRLQIAEAQSLQRIEQRAREVLHMRSAESTQLRYLTVEVPALPAVAHSRR